MHVRKSDYVMKEGERGMQANEAKEERRTRTPPYATADRSSLLPSTYSDELARPVLRPP